MRRQLYTTLYLSVIAIGLVACTKESAPPPPPKPKSSFVEGFDVFANLMQKGWVFTNNSSPIGTTTWFQGGTTFNAQSSELSPTSYAAVNYNSVGSTGTISNWMFSPAVEIKTGDEIIFYTRAASTTFPERLQVRINPYNESVNVGNTATSVGDFNVLLKDINPTYLGAGGFPATWTKYVVPVTGISGLGKRRFSFRYFVEDGGLNGANSNYIGVDSVAFVSK